MKLSAQSASDNETAIVSEAIVSRRSIRGYLPRPVARETVQDILQVASRAPSGSNIQPWHVHVVMGASRQRLCDAVLAAYNDPSVAKTHRPEYQYYPVNWFEPFLARRRKVGWELYKLLGIERGDKTRMHDYHGRNYLFFDAPVGLVFTINRGLEQGSWLDCGMFIQSVMIAARGFGLDTCPQASFNTYHRIVQHTLGIPDDQQLVCCMALGYADPEKIENSLRSERLDPSEFVTFVD